MKALTTSFIIIVSLAISTLLVFTTALKALTAVAAIIAVATILYRPLVGLLLFAFVATFTPYTVIKLGARITISEALLLLTWISVGWRMLGNEISWPDGKTEKKLVNLILFSLFPFLIGEFSVVADGNGLVNWFRWILNLSTLFIIPILITTKSARDKLLFALLAGTAMMLILSIFYFLKDRDANTFIPVLEKLNYFHIDAVKDIFSANYTRMGSPWVHPNLTGGVLAMIIPLSFYYAIFQKGFSKFLPVLVTLLGVMGLLFSISRGAIVSLAIVFIWLTWLGAPYASKVIKLSILVTILAVLFYPPLQTRLSTTFSAKNASTEVRLDEYKKFPEAFLRYPLGIGFKTDPPPDEDLLGISNLWLNYIYKIGVVGMILFISVTKAWWAEVKPPTQKLKITDQEHALWLGSMSGLLSALLTGLFDHYYSFTFVLIAIFWLIMAINLQTARSLANVSIESS